MPRPGSRLSRIAIAAIVAYRRWLSPHKGFACAWAAGSGAPSCSDYGLRAFTRHRPLTAWALLQRQFDRCAARAQTMPHRGGASQRGEVLCDPSGACESVASAAACASCDGACSSSNAPKRALRDYDRWKARQERR